MLAGHSVHPPVGFKAGICRVLIAASIHAGFSGTGKRKGARNGYHEVP